ncbi:Trehalose import ATP-binding protein SugC [Baekduia alba]|uniref:ABC transporter ATP-binding protein n=1 Tax=Baekduia alba TaxID=2997333 RepID=UPI0023412A75|nr:sn-glycerol-3-phosphate ABC transporter ATP-binding protein UgpC [Baekduia alba]WCB93424.1 Trehalose import ATP-binding protein SugC [Baekduia alba]
MAQIQLDEVTKEYPDGTEAVKALSLDIADGEFLILVGPSGCGKSTALRMLAGLEDISAGELRIGGERVNERPAKARDVAMVFQSYALYPHMTVRQNMGFSLKMAKLDRQAIAAKVDDAARVLDLTEHLERKPANLSGGQRQRVAMGRAIVRDPKAFLMDEPLSNLDTKLRVQMRAEIARIQSLLATTTVYVTHDQTEAMTLGDRVAVMRAGELQQVGTPTELYEAPANVFVGGFIGSPAMNFVVATVEGDVLRLPFGALDAPRALLERLRAGAPDRREVVVGIRPEAFEDAATDGGPHRDGLTFEPAIELVEVLGPEVYAYFRAGDVPAEHRALLDELGAADRQLVARLPAGARAAGGQRTRLWMDAEHLLLFDPGTGRRLGAAS